MTYETPTQRRTRLIEQYTGLACVAIDTEWGAMLPQIEQVLHWSTRLADAVIAATPQEREACHDSEQEVDELREHINDLEILLTDARANLEIERHRKKQTNSDYDGITKEAQTFMFKQGRKDLGYPSEIETRLIELVEYCVRCVLGFQDAEHVKGVLAAIKRDLGLP